jgi:hypothetical protein
LGSLLSPRKSGIYLEIDVYLRDSPLRGIPPPHPIVELALLCSGYKEFSEKNNLLFGITEQESE